MSIVLFNEELLYGKGQHHSGKLADYRMANNFINYTPNRWPWFKIWKELKYPNITDPIKTWDTDINRASSRENTHNYEALLEK